MRETYYSDTAIGGFLLCKKKTIYIVHSCARNANLQQNSIKTIRKIVFSILNCDIC